MPRTILPQKNYGEGVILCDEVRQNNVLRKLSKLEKLVIESEDKQLINTWGKLQAADHFPFIRGLRYNGGDVYQLMNPLNCPIGTFQQMSNILTDFEIQLIRNNVEKNRSRFSHQLMTMLF